VSRQYASTKKLSTLLNDSVPDRSITLVRVLDYGTLKTFVATPDDSSLTVGKKIERLRTFMCHCNDMGWCEINPATKVQR
jgi:hypothetical protein